MLPGFRFSNNKARIISARLVTVQVTRAVSQPQLMRTLAGKLDALNTGHLIDDDNTWRLDQ